MTTKTKILSVLVLSTTLATGAFAYGNKGECNMQNNHKMMKKHISHKKMRNPIFSTLKKLNLSDSQKTQIKKIMQDSKKQKQTISDAFTKSNFDKEKYIKIMSEKRQNMLKSRALKIEKIYAVLDDTQKEQFKTLIDLKAQKMQKKGMNFDKNCNGRG
ncbi:Spy/CpxP family protein refolding chaperone [Malaciobacter sp. WC5094]|uniref:Spy/CpxP family protein refolding chaperone n=1 Tax=Arcobacter sp. YIC-80 TaxID=3376683 RepID=UPI00384FF30B